MDGEGKDKRKKKEISSARGKCEKSDAASNAYNIFLSLGNCLPQVVGIVLSIINYCRLSSFEEAYFYYLNL